MTQNIDTSEVEKFADLAERWWDPKGEFKPLHIINPLRAEFIASRVELENMESYVFTLRTLRTDAKKRTGLLVDMNKTKISERKSERVVKSKKKKKIAKRSESSTKNKKKKRAFSWVFRPFSTVLKRFRKS